MARHFGGQALKYPPWFEQECYSAQVSTEIGSPSPGLCADCIHARVIRSDRNSVFYLCELSLSDPRFEKYPRLPVLSCAGYEQRTPSNQ